MQIIRFAFYWAGWGALVGAISAVAITAAIVLITGPGLFSIENYWVAGVLGALIGAPIAVLAGFIQAWKENSD
jgi:hypothetical protein